jgi:uncharacterized protein (DUF1778 family)
MGEDKEKTSTVTLRATADEKRMLKVIAAEMQKPMRDVVFDYVKAKYAEIKKG